MVVVESWVRWGRMEWACLGRSLSARVLSHRRQLHHAELVGVHCVDQR